MLLLICAGSRGQVRVWVEKGNAAVVGGLWARLVGSGVCARAPSLISVRDPEFLQVGDMMVDGVIPLGEALRPLGL